jgi:aspartyl-tRNA(Asn)/glutamyl-tRNA(Gln) amidotransferase subunit B
MSRDIVIGIEIHCELKTNAKMFSASKNAINDTPNQHVNEIDLGHPGVLPTVNKKAVELALRACMLTHCNIDPHLKFDRKNYYYSDLPKGFQITQQFHPIGKDGYLDLNVNGKAKRVRLDRIHMEEDTAKQTHIGEDTFIDYNRAGVPLIEIVSKPDIESADEAKEYVATLRNALIFADVTDGKMEEGSLRCDINISLKDKGTSTFGTKVEIKNLNSLNNIEKAIEAEIARQNELLNRGEKVKMQTRRYDEATKSTVAMRSKESAVDYRYFPEPNIRPIMLETSWIEAVKEALPWTPEKWIEYLISCGATLIEANILINNKPLLDFSAQALKKVKDMRLCLNWTISELTSYMNTMQEALFTSLTPHDFALFLNLISDKVISGKQAKDVLKWMIESGRNAQSIVDEHGLVMVSDDQALLKWIDEALLENPQSIIDFKQGKDRAVGFLVGQVMKKSKGQADPALCNALVRQRLQEL